MWKKLLYYLQQIENGCTTPNRRYKMSSSAAHNFLMEWKAGFVFPAISPTPDALTSSGSYAVLPFADSDAVSGYVNKLDKLVGGVCFGFVIRDDSGEHYECSCVVGVLKRAKSLADLESDVRRYDTRNADRIIRYFQRVYSEEYRSLRR